MIGVNNFTRFAVGDKFLRKTAEKVLAGEKKECIQLSVSLVGPSEIKKLNKKYRNIDRPTDVLSFAYKDSLGRSPMSESGEIVICPAIVKENAKKYGEDFKKEFRKVFIHGILHILGYDHEKDEKTAAKMLKKQEYYLSNLKFKSQNAK
jgi:probable rRNA maturation factor